MNFIFSLFIYFLIGASLTQAQAPLLVHKIELSGLKNTQEFVVLREIQQKTQNPWSLSLTQSDIQRLYDLDLFAKISVHADTSDSGITLHYEFKELVQNLVFPALKVSDGGGWILGPAFASLNLFGQDIRTEAFYRVSVYPKWAQTQEYLLSLSSPYIYKTPIEYDISLIRTESDHPIFHFPERSLWIKGEFQPKISSAWRGILEWSSFFIDHTDSNRAFLSTQNRDISSIASLGILLDLRDRRTNPHNGLYQELRFGKSINSFSNAESYKEVIADSRFFYAPFGPSHIFHFAQLLDLRKGQVAFYNQRILGGSNSFRPLTPDSSLASAGEWLGSFEYRTEWFDKKPFRWNSLDVDGWWGLQTIIGYDLAQQFNQDLHSQSFFHGPVIGLHLLSPGIDRFRLEWSALSAKKVSLQFQTGLFERSQTSRWRNR